MNNPYRELLDEAAAHIESAASNEVPEAWALTERIRAVLDEPETPLAERLHDALSHDARGCEHHLYLTPQCERLAKVLA